jgi:hypothetical protein
MSDEIERPSFGKWIGGIAALILTAGGLLAGGRVIRPDDLWWFAYVAIGLTGVGFLGHVLEWKIGRRRRAVTAAISYQVILDGSKPDSMTVAVTNRSPSSIYIRSCVVRSTYPLRHLVALHLRHPLLRPKLYPNLWYNGCVYEFVKSEPVQLESAQLKELTLAIHEHPLNTIYGPMLIAKVELTTGEVVRSKRIPSPKVWRMIGNRGR